MMVEMMSEYEIKRFDELQVGDVICGDDGDTTVVKVGDIHQFETTYCMEVTQDDGSVDSMVLSGDHLLYVVSELDLATHKERVKKARKLLRKLPKSTVQTLKDLATVDEGEVEHETSLADFVSLLSDDGGLPVKETTQMLLRVVQSLGHLSENKAVGVDPTGTVVHGYNVIRLYSAKAMARQLLSMLERKSPYQTLIGRVMTAEEAAKLIEAGIELIIPGRKQ